MKFLFSAYFTTYFTYNFKVSQTRLSSGEGFYFGKNLETIYIMGFNAAKVISKNKR